MPFIKYQPVDVANDVPPFRKSLPTIKISPADFIKMTIQTLRYNLHH